MLFVLCFPFTDTRHITVIHSSSMTPYLARNKFDLRSEFSDLLVHGKTSEFCPVTRAVNNIQSRCLHSTSRSCSVDDKKSSEPKDGTSDDLAKTYTDSQKSSGEPAKLTLVQRFKKAYKEHGKILIGVHIATSVMWYASFYALARRYCVFFNYILYY